MPDDLDAKVRLLVTHWLHQGQAFTPQDVARELEPLLGAVPIRQVAAAVRRLFDDGLFKPFGFRRTLRQERTRQGMVTAVLYAPGQPARSSPGSRAPTRKPAPRGLGYLGLGPRDQRRLERQTKAIQGHIHSLSREVVKAGELLNGARAILGPGGLALYVERELSMSAHTARRLMRAARLLADHPSFERLALAKPSLLYKLSEPSFPGRLREAILRDGGLAVDGLLQPLERLRVKDLEDAKRLHGDKAQQSQGKVDLEEVADRARALVSASPDERKARAAELRRLLERLEDPDL